jgi:hypothetical protein
LKGGSEIAPVKDRASFADMPGWEDKTTECSKNDFRLLKKDFTDEAGTESRYILQLASGVEVTLSSFGATVVSVMHPDSSGKVEDVVLGYDTRKEYDHPDNPYFGATCGRVSNRITKGQFKIGHE